MAEGNGRNETVGTGTVLIVWEVVRYRYSAVFSNVSNALLVDIENVRAIVLDDVVLVGGLVVQKLVRMLVVTNAHPLVTGESAVSSEVTSQVDLLLRKIIDKVLQARLLDCMDQRRNAALITLIDDSTDERVRVAEIVVRDHKRTTTYLHGGSMGGGRGPMVSPAVFHIFSGEKRSIILKFD